MLTYPIVSKVNIRIPFEVTYHNADSVDLETNTYTWNVTNTDEEKEQKIKFVADTSKKKYEVREIIKIASIIVLTFTCIVVVTVMLRAKSRRKNKL